MEKSIFTDKNSIPNQNDLMESLEKSFHLWQLIVDTVHAKYPDSSDEWNYPGVKYGWSFRMKDKKRTILYLLPRDHYFKVAFVFGQKATDAIMNSNIAETIKTELIAARVYAEGRGIRIDIKNDMLINEIKELINIKFSF